MVLLRKITANKSVFAQVLWVIIISILVCFIGYIFGKFIWYISH